MEEKNPVSEKRERWNEKWRWGVVAFVVIVASVTFIFILLRYKDFVKTLDNILSAAQPIIIGLVIAYLLSPIVNFWDELILKGLKKHMKRESKAKKLSRALSTGISILLFIFALTLLIWSIAPSIVKSVASLVETLPWQVQHLIDQLKNWKFEDNLIMKTVESSLTSGISYVQDYVKNGFIPQAQTYLTMLTSGVLSVAKGILNFIIGVIVATYVLAIKETLKGQSKKVMYSIFRAKQANVILTTVRKTSDIFGGFISGKLIDSLIIGILCYIGCLILRIPQPLLIAVIIGVTNIIPVFGPFIGAIPALFLVLIASPLHALYLLIFIVILQQVDGNIIGPKILGNSTGLSTFWVMFSILVGSGLWGFMGMLLGVPVFAVIYYIVRQLVDYGIKKKNLPPGTLDYIDSDLVDLETNQLTYPKDEMSENSRKSKKKEKPSGNVEEDQGKQ